MFADRGERLRKLVGNDDAELSVQTIMKLGRLPKWLVKAGEFLLKQFDKFGSSIIGASKGYDSLYEYFGHVSKFMDWQESFMKTWMDENLDAVICPVFPSSAVTRDIIPFVAACGIYCQMYNSLNYPAGVIPVTKVTQEDLDNAFNHKIFTPNSTVDKLLLKSSKGSVGLSVGVQCVALPYKDEMCLRVMREIERGLKN
uniref:Amidase domain-containing protein n=2 Tax=Arion vulgaris TaxID=1028688 RepID=A0A0B6ZXD1_9EUPU